MNTISEINNTYQGADNKESLYDLHIPSNWNNKLIIFIHGFQGFKDWGSWALVEKFFTEKGFGFLKYNVSHNGCTTEKQTEFADLDAFGENNYSKELEDLDVILDTVRSRFDNDPEISLIGHSRGGGIALLQSHNNHVSRICSWAGISSIGTRFPKGEELEEWKKAGVRHITNGRTGQQMPLNYSQFLDYLDHKSRLNIEFYCRTSNKPTLIIHGDSDEAVSVDESRSITDWIGIEPIIIPGAGHTFGSVHPRVSDELPEQLLLVCEHTLQFLEQPIDIKKAETQSMVADLIKMAKSDNELREVEFEFLHTLARQLGVTTDEFKELFERYIEFKPPRLEVDRIVQFQRLVLLMNVDQDTSEQELNYIRTVGIRMGLQPRATDEVLRVMNNYEDKVIPPEELIRIFKTFHN